jgi:predicted transcriptional regulator of viral defense system
MGKQIHLKKIEKLFEKSPVVDFKSIERIIGEKKSYAKLLVSNLIKSGKIKKLGKGFYTLHNESSLAVFAFNPAYLGLQSSLSFHGLWEQETIPVILTQKKVRRGIRKIMDSNVLLRTINKKFFFGFKFYKEGNFYLPYSDLEKTFIDMVVFNQKIDRETLKKIIKIINKPVLENYLKKYSKKLKNKVKIKLKI